MSITAQDRQSYSLFFCKRKKPLREIPSFCAVTPRVPLVSQVIQELDRSIELVEELSCTFYQVYTDPRLRSLRTRDARLHMNPLEEFDPWRSQNTLHPVQPWVQKWYAQQHYQMSDVLQRVDLALEALEHSVVCLRGTDLLETSPRSAVEPIEQDSLA
jgi:hypothetical protein